MKRRISGFTLVELLVVITIIGILMGLLLPAVNAARESARRNQCSTQLKNFALAGIQHENAKGQLPGWIQDFGLFEPPASAPFDPSDPTATAAPPRHVKLGTWGVALLPWLDAQPTYEHWTEDRYPILDGTAGEYDDAGNGYHELAAPNIAIFQCPSNPVSVGEFGKNSYISNNGAMHSATPFDPAVTGSSGVGFARSMERANGAFNNKYAGSTTVATGPKVRLDDFKDGQGNTLLFSENVQAQPWHRAGFIGATYLTVAAPATAVAYPETSRYAHGMIWHYEDIDAGATITWSNGTPADAGAAANSQHRINGGGATVSEDRFTLQMTAANASDLARPSSAHVDGVNAGMADGGTRYIVSSIDYRVYQALLTLRGKSSDVPWPEFILTDEVQ